MDKTLTEIPERVAIKDVVVGFVRIASCPDLEVEFFTKEVEIAGAKAHLDRSRLTFRETSQDLSRLLCAWARRISVGRGGASIRAINRRLKGENDE
ncbi:MAG TPA: hypothetical protein VJ810_09435 [Blastocatellia bacterium]|nr:hypothetical protein [Blastocatellia bacterium]